MTPLEPTGPNAEQIKFWNESGIAYYFAHKDAINAERAPLTRRLVDRAAPAAGERALDVGCGFGDLTMKLARRVGRCGFGGIKPAWDLARRGRRIYTGAGIGHSKIPANECASEGDTLEAHRGG